MTYIYIYTPIMYKHILNMYTCIYIYTHIHFYINKYIPIAVFRAIGINGVYLNKMAIVCDIFVDDPTGFGIFWDTPLTKPWGFNQGCLLDCPTVWFPGQIMFNHRLFLGRSPCFARFTTKTCSRIFL